MLIDRENAKKLHKEMNAAIKAVGDKYGLQFEEHSAKYSSESITGRFTLKATPDGTTPEKHEWDKHCTMFGFKKEDFGREFIDTAKRRWVISGLKANSRKYPILVKNSNGTKYVMEAQNVRNFLEFEKVYK